MAENKKIIFEGIDQGVASMYAKIAKQAKEMNLSMMDDARKQSNSAKEQIKFMEQALKQLEQQNKLYKEQQKTLLELSRTKELSGANRPAAIDRINKKYDDAIANLTRDSRESSLISSTLRELLESSREQLRNEELTRRENQQSRERADDREQERLVRGGGKDCIEICKDGGKGSGCCEECAQNANRGAGLGEPGTGGANTGGSGTRGVFGDVLAANLASDAIKSLWKGMMSLLNSAGNMLGGLQDESQVMGEVYGATAGLVPFVGAGISGPVKMMKDREEAMRKKIQTASTGLYASTGMTSIGSNVGLGLDEAEANELAIKYARSAASSQDLRSKTFGAYAMQRMFNLDESLMLEQEKIGRRTGVGAAANTMFSAALFRESGLGLEQLPELLQIQTSLLNQQLQNQANPNALASASLITQFRKLGGGFAGEDLGSKLMALNANLSSPQGDYAQAKNIAALTSLPEYRNADIFELLQAQAKGSDVEGLFSARLKQTVSRVGMGSKGNNAKLALVNEFGFSYDDAENIINKIKEDPTYFDKISAPQDMFAGTKGMPSGVTSYEQTRATIDMAYASGLIEGIKETMKVAGTEIGKEFKTAYDLIAGDGKNKIPRKK